MRCGPKYRHLWPRLLGCRRTPTGTATCTVTELVMGKVALEQDCVLDPETQKLKSCLVTFDMDVYMESRQFTFGLMLLAIAGGLLVYIVYQLKYRRTCTILKNKLGRV